MIELLKEELDLLDKLDWDNSEYIKLKYDPEKPRAANPDEVLDKYMRSGVVDYQYPGRDIYNNRTSYDHKFGVEVIDRICDKLSQYTGSRLVKHRGTFYMPPGSVCGWHTNSNVPGRRVYLTWAEEEGKSCFKYYDKDTDRVITRYDKKGWYVNDFTIPKQGKLWHYISSDTHRKSIGFLIY